MKNENAEELNTVTLKNSSLLINIGDETFNVFMSLRNLQGQKSPYFNATEVVKQHNELSGDSKRIYEWTKSKRFKEIIGIWERDFSVPKSKLYVKERAGSEHKIMLHQDLFLSLMIWLDAKYEMNVTSFVNKTVENLQITTESRQIVKTPTKALNRLISLVGEQLTEEKPDSSAGRRLYSHIQSAVNKTVTGFYGKAAREELTGEQLEQLDYLEHLCIERIAPRYQLGFTAEEIKADVLDILKHLQKNEG